MKEIRRVDLVWQGNEVSVYEKIKKKAKKLQKEIGTIIKEIIKKEL